MTTDVSPLGVFKTTLLRDIASPIKTYVAAFSQWLDTPLPVFSDVIADEAEYFIDATKHGDRVVLWAARTVELLQDKARDKDHSARSSNILLFPQRDAGWLAGLHANPGFEPLVNGVSIVVLDRLRKGFAQPRGIQLALDVHAGPTVEFYCTLCWLFSLDQADGYPLLVSRLKAQLKLFGYLS